MEANGTAPLSTHTLIAAVEAQLANSRRDLDMILGVIMGQGFIVVAAGGFALDFTVTESYVTNPVRTPYAGRALRMTRRDAEAVAHNVTDGAGAQARAVHVREAILTEIKEREELLAALLVAAERAQADFEAYTR